MKSRIIQTGAVALAVATLAACAYGPPIAGLTQQDVDTFLAAGNHPAPITDRAGHCDDPGEFGVMTRESRFDPNDDPVPVLVMGQFPMCVAEYIRRVRDGEKVDHL